HTPVHSLFPTRRSSDLQGHKPKLRARPQHDVLTEPAEVDGKDGARIREVKRKVAVRHGVDAVLSEPGEAELAGDHVTPQGQRCRSEEHTSELQSRFDLV